MWTIYGTFGFLGICGVYDWREKAIPVSVFPVFSVGGLVYQIYCGRLFTASVLCGVLFGFVFWALGRCMPQKLGEGDGLMLMVLGLYLGFWESLEVFLAALLLMVPLSAWMLLRKKWTVRTEAVFAPFLFCAYGALQLLQAAGVR